MLALSPALRAETGAAAAARVEEVLETADRLIAETGACNLTAFVRVKRAALSEPRGEAPERETYLGRAHEAFPRMGATARPPGSLRELAS